MKKALIIVAQEGFQDYEFSVPFDLLTQAGVKIEIASKKKGIAIGKFERKINVDIALSDINIDYYDAIIYIGGPGAVEYQNNFEAKKIAKDAVEKEKIIAAICIAPTILADAGVLTSKKATVWNGNNQQSVYLEKRGAIYIDKNVVIDGNIITANGPSSAQQFAEKILEKLFEK